MAKRVFTDEHRRKISEARKRIMAERGFLNSPEARAKMKAAIRPPISAAQRAKMSAAFKGRLISEAKRTATVTGQKRPRQSIAMKGRVLHWRGNIRAAHLARQGGLHKLGDAKWLRRRIRKLPEYQIWKVAIIARDGGVCRCGAPGAHIHHVKPFSEILGTNSITTIEQAIECSELWDVSNGATLCRPCHKLTRCYLGERGAA
jgi:hypothetical protein